MSEQHGGSIPPRSIQDTTGLNWRSTGGRSGKEASGTGNGFREQQLQPQTAHLCVSLPKQRGLAHPGQRAIAFVVQRKNAVLVPLRCQFESGRRLC
mgnify:CR=1 FL=1